MSKAKKRPIIESDSDDSDAGDLDQELLSLASATKRPKPTQSSGSDSSSESGSDDEWTLDGKGNKKAKVKKSQGIKGRQQQPKKPMAQRRVAPPHSSSESSEEEEGVEEEEEGDNQGTGVSQATSSSGSSSSGSESSSSSESLKFDDGLDDELVGDEEDRVKLAQMTEAEREQEMYNRYEKRQALKARFEIEQKLRRERQVEKRRTREREREERQRRMMREKRSKQQDKSKSRAISELKANRSADKQRRAEAERQQLQQQPKEPPLKASEVFSSGSEEESSSSESSASYEGDSEDEASKRSLAGLRSSASKYISTLEELNKIKLSRFRLEKWVHMPFFVDAAVGCFVRVGIGAHDGRMVYRVCEIIGIQDTPKVYSLGSTKTNKGLRLRHGLQERVFRMEYVSNNQFTESEFSKWKTELGNRGLPLPTVQAVEKKAKQLEQSKNFQFKDEDIDKMIQEKQRFRKNPRNYAMTKSRLLRDKELAEQEGDVDKASSLAQQLEEIEERAEELDKQRTKGLSAISYINERNRQRNVIRAEQALKEEMSGEKKKEDPFTRRKCQPTLVTLGRDNMVPGTTELLQKLSQAETEEDKEAVKAAIKEKAPQLLSPTTPNGQTSRFLEVGQETPDVSLLSSTPALPKPDQKPEVEDLFSAHDFDIQIDLPSGPAGSSSVKAVPKLAPTPKSEGPRRSLNLADYKKRRGLI